MTNGKVISTISCKVIARITEGQFGRERHGKLAGRKTYSMANQQQYYILQQGVAVWNQWRKKHPDILPDLSGIRLIKANLIRADLSRTDLSRASLSRIDLSESDLGEANLSGTILFQANLNQTNLSKANLSLAFLVRSELIRANLSGAKLREANLSNVDLYRADLSPANVMLCSASLTDKIVRTTGSELSGVSRHNGKSNPVAGRPCACSPR